MLRGSRWMKRGELSSFQVDNARLTAGKAGRGT
jgi:hypothetical protein